MKRPQTFRPNVETLDQRTLLSVTLSAGLLEVVGTTGPDQINVGLPSPGKLQVTVDTTGESRTFDLKAVSRILVRPRGGDDSVMISPDVMVPAEVRGWSGDDRITGGGANDLLLGGGGDDTVNGQGGDDTLVGQHGGDMLVGGGGSDRLFGDFGADNSTGGNDTLEGDAGDDSLAGGAGDDKVYGGAGTDRLDGGPGDNTFFDREAADVIVRLGDKSSFQRANANPLRSVSTPAELRGWLAQNSVVSFASWFGKPGSPVTAEDSRRMLPMAGGGVGTTAAGAGGAAGTTDAGTPVSGTNTQVAGVDEADILKTDGKYLYTIAGGEFLVIDARTPDKPAIVGRVAVGDNVNAFYLIGDRAELLSQEYEAVEPKDWPVGMPIALDDGIGDGAGGGAAVGGIALWRGYFSRPQTVVTTVDLSNRTAPVVDHKATLDGNLVDSRAVGGRVYVVIQNSLSVPQPELKQTAGGPVYESEAEYRARLDATLVSALPAYTTSDDGKTATGSLVDGANLYLPDTAGGGQLLSVAAFDPAAPAPVGVTTIAGSSGQVFASVDSLYVASTDYTSPWDDGGGITTQLYKFALRGDAVPLDAVGAVDGTVLNQFSMDEANGHFRIATTGGFGMESSNAVYVLADTGDDLEVVGSLTELGVTERIFAVRFEGDAGYVVTFRQTDPLYTLDLSDPTKPKVVGELKIPGYSSYLQDLGDDRLIGLGRDADPLTGRVRGLKLSLFDVADPADPREVSVLSFSDEMWGGSSEAEWDHHAISWFPDVGILALPVAVDWEHPATLEVLKVSAAGITRVGSIAHKSPVMRSLRIGDNLFSMSSGQIEIHKLTDPSVRVGGIDLPVTADPNPTPVDGPVTVGIAK